MRTVAWAKVKTMDFQAAKYEVKSRVYEAALLFKQLKQAGKVSGNGHRMVQQLVAHAEVMLENRWAGGKKGKGKSIVRKESHMRTVPFAKVQAMDLAAARSAMSFRTYEAALFFERLENTGKLYGNGHHMAQQLVDLADQMLKENWRKESMLRLT
jgi:hypothetical protein